MTAHDTIFKLGECGDLKLCFYQPGGRINKKEEEKKKETRCARAVGKTSGVYRLWEYDGSWLLCSSVLAIFVRDKSAIVFFFSALVFLSFSLPPCIVINSGANVYLPLHSREWLLLGSAILFCFFGGGGGSLTFLSLPFQDRSLVLGTKHTEIK